MHDSGVSGMQYLYMGLFPHLELGYVPDFTLLQGFYIHSCPKMRYKGQYAPSYLADPVTGAQCVA